MKQLFLWRRISVLIQAVLVIGFCTSFSPTTLAYTPESAEVQEAVARAIQYLESDSAVDDRLGAKALVGIVILKNDGPANHPRVEEALGAIREALRDQKKLLQQDNNIYSVGLSAIFLVTLDPKRYRSEIDGMLRLLKTQQKPHGGWGYVNRQTGDTSMTQYGVLSCWEATQSGIPVPIPMIEGGLTWLLKTQDPEGGFGYQGTVSPSFNPVKQREVSIRMTTAGLGSVYVCADLLGFSGVGRREGDLPKALRAVEEDGKTTSRRVSTSIDRRQVKTVQERGNQYFRRHYTISPDQWTNYYLYALERYWSFREVAEGISSSPWYDEGVEYLLSKQQNNGSWTGTSGAVPATSFGALFLLRSMRKSIRKARDFGAGTLVGGRGIPEDTDQAFLSGGKVVSKREVSRTDQLLASLGNNVDAVERADTIEALAELPPKQSRLLVSKYAKQLEGMTKDASPEARLAVIRALGRGGDLKHAPALILALGDSDPDVVLAARDGLRRMSRKFDGFGLPDKFSEPERRDAMDAWKAWYLAFHPDADF